MRINFRPSEFVFSDGLKSFSRLRLTAGWADGKDFVAGLGNQDFVFPLGGEGAVFGDHCPTIVQDAQMAFALVDHRLDGENHARFEDEALTFAAVVDYLRRFVEAAADAVSAEFLYNGVAGIFGNLLAGIADVAESGAGFDRFDTRHHGGVGHVDQALGNRGDFADGKHTAGIAVEAVFLMVRSMLTMSPSFSGLSSGMPWQMTWLTEVQQDFG